MTAQIIRGLQEEARRADQPFMNEVFNQAIHQNRLGTNPVSPLYWQKYAYVNTRNGIDRFMCKTTGRFLR